MAAIGERIRALREERGITQRELAKRIGIAESTMSYYEHGSSDITLKNAVRFADFFQVSLDTLAGATDRESEKCKALRRENASLKKDLARLRCMNLDICEEIRNILFPDPLMMK